MLPRSQIGVVVELVLVLKFVAGVQANAAPPVGQDVSHVSPVKQMVAAEKTVVEAFPTFKIPAIVVEPVLETLKSVLVAVPAVVDEMVNSVVGLPTPVVDVAVMDRSAYGLDVPRPMRSAMSVPV